VNKISENSKLRIAKYKQLLIHNKSGHRMPKTSRVLEEIFDHIYGPEKYNSRETLSLNLIATWTAAGRDAHG